MKHLAVFASGTGSNARRIMEHFAQSPVANVRLLLCNKPDAPVLHIAEAFGVPTLLLDRTAFYQPGHVAQLLAGHAIDFIALAGFLWLLPPCLIQAFEGRIVNIHPALLPRFGGKGMYGMRVHQAVKAAGETQTGITIHYVNERYDEGQIIFQASCPITPQDTPETIAQKVHALEHQYYPQILEQLLGEQ